MNNSTEHEAKSSEIADMVKGFYDQHPYPRPVLDLDEYALRWQDHGRQLADFHLHWPAQPYREDLNILIAGCGTSQAAKHALRHPAAHVVGIDVSSTSIEHTEILRRQYNLTNLELHQFPIDRVRELGQLFDKIVCTGVLHHLPDPDAGLRALHDVLLPDGALHLMVYATYGRVGIYMLQEYGQRLGIGTSEEEIRDLANTLTKLSPEHPLARLLGESPDFRSKAGLADALLHPQDRSYTVPQLFDLLQKAGMVFGRWVRQAPYLPQCGDLGRTPHGARLAQLSPPEQCAAVELFRGTMVRHNVIAYRNDRPDDDQQIRFDNERWLDYVPIRLPQTLCVDEHIPPGAAAVLINQSHTYPDIVLRIDADEKRLLEAINGQLSIAKIAKKVSMGEKRTRNFIERLWRYDQIAFDTSKSG